MKAGIWMVVVLMGALAGEVAAGENKLGPSPRTTEVRPAVASPASKEMTFGFCRLVPNIPGEVVGMEHALYPASIAVADLWRFDEHFKQMPEEQRRTTLRLLEASAKVTILQQPKYGTLTDTAKLAYQGTVTGLFYNPKPGYMGKDQVAFLVEMGEYKIKLIFNIYPVAGSPENPEAIEKLCGKRGQYFRISSASEQLTSSIKGVRLEL